MLYAVIRVRGSAGVNRDILNSMKLMRLNRINHMVLLPDTPTVRGMLQKVKDYVTWGKIDTETLEMVLKSRMKATGNKPITEKELKDLTDGKFKNFSELASGLIENKISLKQIPNVKPIFRLSPPKNGYEGIKRPFRMGGALGNRDDEINKLIRRMV